MKYDPAVGSVTPTNEMEWIYNTKMNVKIKRINLLFILEIIFYIRNYCFSIELNGMRSSQFYTLNYYSIEINGIPRNIQ